MRHVKEPATNATSSMSPVEPKPIDAELLSGWRTMFERDYAQDLSRLGLEDEALFGFEVQYAHLAENDVLKNEFHTRPSEVLRIGNQVLREQFVKHNYSTRPIIRVVGFPDSYRRRVNELRMRDRGSLISVDVKVTSVSPPHGWLKYAHYVCDFCGETTRVEQRRARERKSPSFCKPCWEIEERELKKEGFPAPHLLRLPGSFQIDVSESHYKDIQSIHMREIAFDTQRHLVESRSQFEIEGVVSDDLVGDIKNHSLLRVNGILVVEPVPTRTFAKDTRRMLSIEVFSIEPLPDEE